MGTCTNGSRVDNEVIDICLPSLMKKDRYGNEQFTRWTIKSIDIWPHTPHSLSVQEEVFTRWTMLFTRWASYGPIYERVMSCYWLGRNTPVIFDLDKSFPGWKFTTLTAHEMGSSRDGLL